MLVLIQQKLGGNYGVTKKDGSIHIFISQLVVKQGQVFLIGGLFRPATMV